MSENRKSHVIMLRTAAVLLILVMLSTCLVAGRYARYTTSATASDSARVARFLVTESGELFSQTISVKIAPGQTVQIPVEVKNDSEVSVEYTIEATNAYENLPLEFALLDDNNTVVDGAELLPNVTKALALQIFWPAEQTDDQYIGMVDQIHLTLRVTQID